MEFKLKTIVLEKKKNIPYDYERLSVNELSTTTFERATDVLFEFLNEDASFFPM